MTEPPPQGWLPDIQNRVGGRGSEGPSAGSSLAGGQISGDPDAPSGQRGEARAAVGQPGLPLAKAMVEMRPPTWASIGEGEDRLGPDWAPTGEGEDEDDTPTAPPQGTAPRCSQIGMGGRDSDRRSRLDHRWARLGLGRGNRLGRGGGKRFGRGGGNRLGRGGGNRLGRGRGRNYGLGRSGVSGL